MVSVQARPTPLRAARTGSVRATIRLIRPYQWPKNLIVALPPFLDGSLWHRSALGAVAAAIVLFTVASAATYIVNDLADRDRDRAHPAKCRRPIASGLVSVRSAVVLAALLYTAAGAAISWHPAGYAIPIAVYAVLNLLYSRYLKHIPLLDVFILAAGFVLRITCGALGAGRRLSPWLLLCVLAAALLLGLGKRRAELATGPDAGAAATAHRPALHGYTVQLLDNLIAVVGAVAVIGYVAFLTGDTAGDGWALVTVSTPLSVFALARYLQILFVGRGGADPTRTLIRDPVLAVVGLLWAACFVIAPLVTA